MCPGQGFTALHTATLEVLSSVPSCSPPASLSPVSPVPSNADPFNPDCTFSLLYAGLLLPHSSGLMFDSSRRCFPRPSCNRCSGFQSPWRSEHSTKIVPTVGEGSLASRSARSLGGLHHCGADLIGMDRGEECQQSCQHRLSGASFKYDPHFESHKGLFSPAHSSCCARTVSPRPAHLPMPRCCRRPIPVQQPQAAGGTVGPCTETSPALATLAAALPLPGSVSCRSVNHTPAFCLLFFLFVLHFLTLQTFALFFGSPCEVR